MTNPNLLDFMLGFSADAPSIFPHNPDDENAWRPSGGFREYYGGQYGPSTTGMYIRPDDAIGVSCVFRAIQLWSGIMGTAPLKFYRVTDDDRLDILAKYPLLYVLSTDRGQANPYQTAMHWRMWTEAQCDLWGIGLSEIQWAMVKGRKQMQLMPIDADKITTIDLLPDGTKRYHVSGRPNPLLQDEVFALEGFGTHHLIPENTLRRSREAVATWLAQQTFRGVFYDRGATPSFVVKHPGKMTEKSLDRFKKEFQGKVGGNRNAHKIAVIEEGMEIQKVSFSAKESLLVDAWEKQGVELARFLGVFAYQIDAGEAPPFAGREQATREFLDFSATPKAELWNNAIWQHLIVEDDVVCRLDMSRYEKGDALVQAQVDSIHTMNGIRPVDEVRADHGWNPLPNGAGAVATRSGNLSNGGGAIGGSQGGDPTSPRPDNPGDKKKKGQKPNTGLDAGISAVLAIGEDDPTCEALREFVDATAIAASPQPADPSIARLHRIFEQSARAIVKTEIKLLTQGSRKADDLARFYFDHATHMAERLVMNVELARSYCTEHALLIRRIGIDAACESWKKDDMAAPVHHIMKLGLGV